LGAPTITWLNNLLQLTVAGAVNGSAYALLGVAFGLIIGVTGRFHFAFTFTYTLAAFTAAEVGSRWGLPFWAALLVGALVGACLGIAIEWLIYQPLAKRSGPNALLIIFVASLGLAIAGTNAIALTWISSDTKSISGFTNAAITFGPITFTTLNLTMVLVSWLLIFALARILVATTLGRMIRAVRSNPEMSLAVGVDPRMIYAVVFAIGSFLGGVSAVFQATQTAATADMGFTPLFYAFVVAFLAGLGSPPLTVGLVALALGLVESWSTLFLPTQWSALVVFTILFVYVALRPVQLGGTLRRIASGSQPRSARG
jgi:branched-chain amino acid transport system permease protein